MAVATSGILGKRTFGRQAISLVLWATLGVFAAFAPVSAQTRFSPAIRVDGAVITTYELSQRQAFLTLLRAPGDIRALAADQLINEKLQMREAGKAGITADAEAVKAGMEEFAARGNLTADQLLQIFAQAGIATETFRDFVTAGVIWRDYVKATFAPRASISQHDIDMAMGKAVVEPGLRVLLSEIVLPAGDPASRKASMARAQRLTSLDEAGFTDAAMRFSTGPSRNNGGKLNWIDITALPANAGAAVRGLKPGQTSRIIEEAEGLRLYFMRDREEVSGGTPRTALDYAALLLPGGQSQPNLDEVARIRSRVVTCDDLYPIARRFAPEQLVRETLPEGEVPANYRAELDRLDPGEISSRLTTGSGAMVVLMLCQRGNEVPRSLTRDAVEKQLISKRVGTLAQFFLDDLRANAHIEMIGN